MSGAVPATAGAGGRTRDERGGSLVEMAYLFPVLMIVLVGAMSLLWMVGARAALGLGLKHGARYAAIRPVGGTYPSSSAVHDKVRDKVPLFDVNGIEVCYYRTASPETCVDPAPNMRVRVKATSPLPDIFVPFAGLFAVGDKVVATSGEARVE